jgi:hypothetical protein
MTKNVHRREIAMYTVKELIDVLKDCPPDYQVTITVDGFMSDIKAIGIDRESMFVDLFGE